MRHLGRECRDPETRDGVPGINKEQLIIQIVHPYTLDTRNHNISCWYNLDPAC